MLALFAVALVLRVAAAVALEVAGVHLLPDSSGFWETAGLLARGSPLPAENVYQQTAGLLWPLAALRWLGAPYLVARLATALAGALLVPVVVRVTELVFERRVVAVGAGLLVAVWPTQIAYSASVTKDPLVWLALATATLACLHLVVPDGAPARAHAAWSAAGVGALLWLGTLRIPVMIAAVWILVSLAGVGAWRRLEGGRRLAAVGAGCAAVVVLPAILGLGPAGAGYVADAGEKIDTRAAGAEPTDGEGRAPGAEPTTGEGGSASEQHGGANTCTSFSPWISADGWVMGLLRLGRGASATLVEPLPWARVCSATGQLAKLVVLGRGVLVALAVAGLWGRGTVVRRGGPLLLVGAGLLAVGAAGEVNVGTAFRHGESLLWIIAVFAAGGARRWWAAFRVGP